MVIKIRILICDDDSQFIADLKHYLNEYFNDKNIGDIMYYEYTSGVPILDDNIEYDMAFVDVEMPEVCGIDVGKALMQKNKCLLLFLVSSHREYNDDGYRINAFRFVDKPIDKSRLHRNMNDAMYKYKYNSQLVQIELDGMIQDIHANNIILIEVVGRKTIIYTVTNSQIETDATMKFWEEKLLQDSYSFYQTNRAYIVNLNYVSDYDKSHVYFRRTSCIARLSKRKHGDFVKKYKLNLANTI